MAAEDTLAVEGSRAAVASPAEVDHSAEEALQEVGEIPMLRTRARCACSSFLLIFASPALATEPKFPTLTGRVVDDAGILNLTTRNELTDMLAAHEHTTGEQVVVVTLDSLQGYTIEDYGYQLGRHWGIGQKGKNNGALLIVAPNEHKVRIEVGYGLEGTLTDATSRTIIETTILPSFKRGDFNAGVFAGRQSILKYSAPTMSSSQATRPTKRRKETPRRPTG